MIKATDSNHFIEININKQEEYYVSVHTGSRALGRAICSHHQAKINDTKYVDYNEFDDTKKKLSRKIKDSKEMKKVCDKLMLDIRENLHTDYLEGEDSYLYYFDMIFAQKFAQFNRLAILKVILEYFVIEYDRNKVIESIHNYIDFNDLIARKGAITAYKDKECIVSLNMRDGVLLCKGKSNSDWNYSSAHGAGRLLNRQKAFSSIKLSDFQKSMEGIYSTSVCEETIDEAPFAYKDVEMIKNAIGDSVEIIEQLKPVMNIKALC